VLAAVVLLAAVALLAAVLLTAMFLLTNVVWRAAVLPCSPPLSCLN
jgi:hypothetical protein